MMKNKTAAPTATHAFTSASVFFAAKQPQEEDGALSKDDVPQSWTFRVGYLQM